MVVHTTETGLSSDRARLLLECSFSYNARIKCWIVRTLQCFSPVVPDGILSLNTFNRIKFGDICMKCPEQFPEGFR